MIILSHPTGNLNVRELLYGLHSRKLLSRFYTTLAISDEEKWANFLPGRLKRQALRRSYNLPRAKIYKHPFMEFARLLLNAASVDSVYRNLDDTVSKNLRRERQIGEIKATYCYEDGAVETFRAARELGIKTLYDLPIAYWRTGLNILTEEAQLNPEWASTLQIIFDSEEKQMRKDQELHNADCVFVASAFTRNSLKSSNYQGPVEVIPYGAPVGSIKESARRKGKLRALFVGGLSQRKGLSYLFESIKKLGNNIELTVIGKRIAANSKVDNFLSTVRYIQSAPHSEILAEMSQHDVLIFPSLVEGFGLVIVEAMSCGLPVITTPHTAGPDIISDGVDGFIVPIRSADAITERLEMLISNSQLLESMSRAAFNTARKLSWCNYQQKMALSISRLIEINNA